MAVHFVALRLHGVHPAGGRQDRCTCDRLLASQGDDRIPIYQFGAAFSYPLLDRQLSADVKPGLLVHLAKKKNICRTAGSWVT